jgi:Xaa-Pro aminopeptidase
MSAPATVPAVVPPSQLDINLAGPTDRRADVDAKQTRVAKLLHDLGCDGLLILEPENFAWLTSGGAARGVLDPRELPALYFTPEGRWALSSNVDSQRLFDEELDGLGFQLKEWPWHGGRAQLLTDLCQGRKVACDRQQGECQAIGEKLAHLRRALTPYEQACFQALGLLLSHALEATCRTMNPGDTEREVAGQLCHRLIHRGAQPVAVGVAADGRSRLYRHHGFTAAAVTHFAIVCATARKYGLCATASRSVSFGAAEPSFRREHDSACRVSATYIASSWPDAMPRQVLTTARRVYQVTGAEHEWMLCPQGHVTGRAPVELLVTPETEELFQPGWAITWSGSVGAALCCDTVLVMEDGPRTITPAELWPLKRIRVQGAEFVRPDILQR